MNTKLPKLLLAGAGMLLTPLLAHAHQSAAGHSWAAGFSHPWLGWDHLLVMLAVGIWAA